MKLTLFALSLLFASSSALFFKKGIGAGVIVQAGGPVKTIQAPVTRVRQLQPIIQQEIQAAPIVHTSSEAVVPVVSSTHDVQVVNVPVDPPVQRAQVVSVEPSGQSVHLVFKSQTSPLSIQQQHLPSERTYYETTRSEEQPHVIRHEVFKPVVQELRETIQPYRHVTQEIKPVLEKVNILVPRGQQVVRQQAEIQPIQTTRFWPIRPPSSIFPQFVPTLEQIVSKPQTVQQQQPIQVPREQQQYQPIQQQQQQQQQQQTVHFRELPQQSLVLEQRQPFDEPQVSVEENVE